MLEDSLEGKAKMYKTFNTVLLEVCMIIAKTGSTVCRKKNMGTLLLSQKNYDYRGKKMLESQSVVKMTRNALSVIWKFTSCARTYTHRDLTNSYGILFNQFKLLQSACSESCMFLGILWL